jgi:hypothetical protein
VWLKGCAVIVRFSPGFLDGSGCKGIPLVGAGYVRVGVRTLRVDGTRDRALWHYTLFSDLVGGLAHILLLAPRKASGASIFGTLAAYSRCCHDSILFIVPLSISGASRVWLKACLTVLTS